MSKYYTVNTSNAFGALDIESDSEETVLLTAPALPVVEEVPVAPVEQKERKYKGKPRGNRDGPRPARREKNSDNVGTDAVPGEDGDQRRANRDKASRPPRRGGRDFVPREGKKTFDRQGGAQKVKETTDAAAQLVDENAAADAPTEQEPVVVAEPVVEEVRESFADFVAKRDSKRVVVTGSVDTEVFAAITKEITDSGFQAYTAPEVEIYAPTQKKSQKKKSEGKVAPDLFALAGKTAPLKQYGNRDNRRNDKRDNKKATDNVSSPDKKNKKLYKDESVFPSLG